MKDTAYLPWKSALYVDFVQHCKYLSVKCLNVKWYYDVCSLEIYVYAKKKDVLYKIYMYCEVCMLFEC